MGKEQLKSISPVKLYSPWQADDLDTKSTNNQLFGLAEVSTTPFENVLMYVHSSLKLKEFNLLLTSPVSWMRT